MTDEQRPGGYTSVPTWMIRDRGLKRSSVMVYASLASRAGLGAIFPSQETIAEEAGVSVRTVRSALVELEEIGVVERIARRATEGKRTAMTTAYLLHPHGMTDQAAELAGSSKQPEEATGNTPLFAPLIEVTRGGRAPQQKAHALPASWEPNETHRAKASERGLDLAHEVESFRLHAEANARTAVRWDAAFSQWLLKARPLVTATPGGRPSNVTPTEYWGAGNEWMERG